VKSPYWDNGSVTEAGAITWSYEANGIYGPITVDNSVRGVISGSGPFMVFQYDPVYDQLVVGHWVDNMVTIFTRRNLPSSFFKSNPANGATRVSTSPTLSWGMSSGATGYEYCYETTDDYPCSGWTSNGTATSVNLSGLPAGTTYYWQVRAVNSDGTTYADNSAMDFWEFTTGNFGLFYLPVVTK
jgi:hypothetical protein